MKKQYNNLPLVLVILDGWGIAAHSRGNAISEARLPFYNSLIQNYKTFSLAAGGEAVGLPWGEPGNSEVGHQNLGAGFIVYQDVLKINKSIEDESFFEKEIFLEAVNHSKKHNSSFHILGILSDGGIHGHQDHIYAALELASRHSLKRVFLHIFLDGRDTTYNSGIKYIKQLEKIIKRLKIGSIATISGRFYAMDRDNHWDRIEKVYKAMVKGEADQSFESAGDAVNESYKQKVYDEEFVPTIIEQSGHNGLARIQPGDSVIFTNYRPDRARQLTTAFVLPSFNKFNRTLLSNVYFATMTSYDPDIPVHVAFTKESIKNPIARVISEHGLTQLHIAETEKYAHVTYFFNGGKDTVYKGQENKIIPSSGVASYADKPEMSTLEISKYVLSSLTSSKHQFIVVNFANADMVGHTGNLRATIEGLKVVDSVLKQIIKKVAKNGGITIITSDHGNAEAMVNWEDGHIIKEHNSNPVPCTIVGDLYKFEKPKQKEFSLSSLKVTGVLSDVSPTILNIIGIEIPPDMTSRSLI